MKLLTKADLLQRLTDMHERIVADPILLGPDVGVLVRELTAEQRVQAQQAAGQEDADNPNEALYRALLMQFCVVDPDSGRPYADGRTNGDGSPRIDPRTRMPLFTADEIIDLMAGRALLVDKLVNEISSLSALRPTDYKSSGPALNGVQRDAGPRAEGTGEEPPRASDQGSGGDDRRTLRTPEPSDSGGPGVERLSQSALVE